MDLLIFFLYVFAYIFLGFSLKLIDQINDENYEINNKIKIIILISAPILGGIVMGTDLFNASIGLMLILGLFFAKKVNVTDFKIFGTLAIIAMFVMSIFNNFYVFLNFINIIPTTIILLIAIIADELLNEYLDSKKFERPIFKNLMSIRPILKVMVFILPIFNLFTYYHAIMLLCFDIAYDLTKYFTEKK
ncbi:MAG: hypothetical protein EAX96_15315 [Candidatus Lokiarchaeota archaeon]|nr:hypothetical protein [Candidatus Lokiarchaeota archaeon]